jgi:hypothetical protein
MKKIITVILVVVLIVAVCNSIVMVIGHMIYPGSGGTFNSAIRRLFPTTYVIKLNGMVKSSDGNIIEIHTTAGRFNVVKLTIGWEKLLEPMEYDTQYHITTIGYAFTQNVVLLVEKFEPIE